MMASPIRRKDVFLSISKCLISLSLTLPSQFSGLLLRISNLGREPLFVVLSGTLFYSHSSVPRTVPDTGEVNINNDLRP